jgi:tetratricopeptide (TPR) repeat protein
MEALIQNLAGQSQSSEQNPEKLSTAENYRTEGNEHFKKGDLKKAMGAYHNALMYLKSLNGPSQELSEKAKAIKLACYLNLAAAQLKESHWDKVIKYSTEALVIEPKNVKALFRRGKAHHNDKNLDAAEADLEAALRVEPNNAEVVQELQRVREKMKAHKQKEKQKFAGFFDKLSDE